MTATRDEAVALTSAPAFGGYRKKGKCLICETRPRRVEGFCSICNSKIEAERARRNKHKEQPFKYLTWRGMTVELHPNGDDSTFKVSRSKRDPTKLPKSKLIDLNKRVDGFTREQIKTLKRAILQVHLIHLPKVKVN